MSEIAAVLMDVEGTTTPVTFVTQTLFPYAQGRLAAWCAANAGHTALAAVRAAAPGLDELAALRDWMARDEKVTALKEVQGLIWADGYASGEIVGEIYPDVAPALRRWARGGVKLLVYSSGSVAAQKLLFGHSAAGDLTGLFGGFFDTRVGGKRAAESYAAICRGTNVAGAEMLFLSDVGEELDAAKAAGLVTCQLVRAADGTRACGRHERAAAFDEVAEKFGLPAAV
jgi:enolase-phosphatase E1